MHEQLALAPRLVVLAVAVRVGRDVCANQPHFAVADQGKAILQVGVAGADRLDLRAREHDASLDRVFDDIVMAGLAVAGQDLDAFGFFPVMDEPLP